MSGSAKCIFCGTQNGNQDRYCRLCRSPLGDAAGSWKAPQGASLPGTPRGLPAMLLAGVLVLLLGGGVFAARGMIDSAHQGSTGVPAAATTAPTATHAATARPAGAATPSPARAGSTPHATRPVHTATSRVREESCATSPNEHGAAGQAGKAGQHGSAGDSGKAGQNGNQSNSGQGLEVGQSCGTP